MLIKVESKCSRKREEIWVDEEQRDYGQYNQDTKKEEWS